MSVHPIPELSPEAVLVHLLDPISELPMQSWTFVSTSSVSIGRGSDRDVTVNHPYVSRIHAEIQFRSGDWFLVAQSQNGVLVRDESISDYAIEGAVDFRLGKKGPLLRFEKAKPKSQIETTLCFEIEDEFMLEIDESKVKREVTEIADGDYFQSLQSKAKLLKERRASNE